MNTLAPALYDALINDNITVVLENKLSLGDQLSATNNTALHISCQYGSFKCVEQILTVHESLLLKINSRGETALHLAARGGHLDVVEALIHAAKSSRQQPFSSVLQSLIRTPNAELETALHTAVRYNHKDVVHLLVKDDPSHLYVQNKYDETPIYMASVRHSSEIIKTILDTCEWHNFGGPDGRTALHAAVLDDGGLDCAELLLEKNKDLIKIADDYGWTVFHYVAYNDLCKTVEKLAIADQFVGYLTDTEYKRTALHIAACRGNVDVMKELIKYFPDSWEIVDKSGRNILHMAVEQDQKGVIKFIMSNNYKGSNLLIQRDNEGNTPLHLIAKFGCYVEELLMDLGSVDWAVLNDRHLTPLDVLMDAMPHGQEAYAVAVADKAMAKRRLVNANVKNHWHLWRTLKEPDIESVDNAVVEAEKEKLEMEDYRKMISTHMIVAALITTVALTAGFAMPGGFDGTTGSPVLLGKKSFQAFIVTDTLALFFSVCSLSLYFVTTMCKDISMVRSQFTVSVSINGSSVILMSIAFITGTYAVLDQSPKLAIGLCVFSSLYLSLVFSLLYVSGIFDS